MKINNALSRLCYHLLRLCLQRYRGHKALTLLETIETELRAYGHGRDARYPPAYHRRLGAPWQWFAVGLFHRDPAAFWRLHRRWAWSRLAKLDVSVLRAYEQDALRYELDIHHKNPFEHYFGFFEFGLLQRLIELLRPGDVVFDIGANCGLFALPIARHVGQGKVLAFEPNLAMVRLIQAHAKDNGIDGQVEVHPYALGTEDAHLKLSVPPHNPGGASLVWGGDNRESIEVPVRDFRRVHRAAGSPVARLVKIDVEGFEPQVVEAMAEFLATHRPRLLIELSPAAYDPDLLIERLRGLGYDRIRCLQDNGAFEPLPRAFHRQINILCDTTE